MTPNHAIKLTAQQLRSSVPSALCALAAAYCERWTKPLRGGCL